ncbi:hypothetical protein IAD21_00116 [Abditibacteriota bacterium]|nr:hypothetical protein IAD21_00116 [Abditibacteriota bacterium]
MDGAQPTITSAKVGFINSGCGCITISLPSATKSFVIVTLVLTSGVMVLSVFWSLSRPTQHDRLEALLQLREWLADKATHKEIEALLSEN